MHSLRPQWGLLAALLCTIATTVQEPSPESAAAAPVRAIRHPARPRGTRRGRAGGDGDWEATTRIDALLLRIRAFPHRRIPRGARARAFAQAELLRAPRALLAAQSGAAAQDSAQQWTLVGPQPTFEGFSGRVTAIAIDPKDNNTVYIGGAEGGVWKTTDGGANWKPLTDFQPALAIGSLAIDPSNPHVIYAGTGEANFNADAYGGMGILKSTDGGNTWSLLAGSLFEQLNIGSLAIDPNDTKVILAGTPAGLFRSADGGETWQYVMFDNATSVLFAPGGAVAYAALISIADVTGIYQSIDGGQTWTISNGAGATALQFPDTAFRITLAISPSSPGTLYVGYDSSTATPSPLGGFYKSTDGGSSWTHIPGNAYCADQCWYNNVLAVSPADPNLLLGGGVQLMQSADGGNTWSASALRYLHVDQHAIAFTPDGSWVYVGNDGGVWASSTANGSFSWINRNGTLALTQFYAGVSVPPGNPSVAFGGTQDNGSLYYSGREWQAVSCGDGSATAIDPVNRQNVYITCAALGPGKGLLQKSTLGGQPGTFVEMDKGISTSEGVPFLPYLTIDPNNPQNLYLTGNKHIYQTTNGGALWTAISPNVTAGGLWPCAIAVAPGDSNTVYSGSCDGVAKVTHNALSGTSSTWQDITPGLPGTAITHIAVDPASAITAYATLSGFQSGHVFATRNGGQTWTDISGNLPDIPANDLAIDPDLKGTLYVATDLGVFWTNTGGQVWSALGSGLPRAAVLSLVLDRGSRTLRAATHGRSVWDLLVPLQGLNLIPLLASAAPLNIPLNAASPALTVTGANFTAASVVLLNGQIRTTTFVSNGELTARPAAGDVSADGFLTVTVYTPGPGGGTSTPYYVKVGPDPGIYPGGFLNAASFLAGNGAAPGSLVSVFGVNLAPGQAAFDKIPLPTTLAGASLAVSESGAGFSADAPLFFASSGQLNIQIPWEARPFDTITFTPTVNGVKGDPVNVDVQFFAPGIFTAGQSGKGQGAVTNALTGQLAAPAGKYPNSQPVKRGGYLSIYCTGLGPVDNPPADGAAASAKPLANTVITPTVTIGTVTAKVTFSGLAPGYIGLNQVNVQVPQTAPTGDAVPVSISDGLGGVSNTVTVAIQ